MNVPHKIVNGVKIDLTETEIAEKEASDRAFELATQSVQWKEARKNAYLEKGWQDPFDVFNDMTNRGVDIVLSDRKLIMERFPNPSLEI